jgi:hypothetical protein
MAGDGGLALTSSHSTRPDQSRAGAGPIVCQVTDSMLLGRWILSFNPDPYGANLLFGRTTALVVEGGYFHRACRGSLLYTPLALAPFFITT